MSNFKHKTGRKPLKLGTVENYHHHWYLLIWLVYLTLFAIAEHVVSDNYWVSYLPLDDKIPFCRYFIIPYCLWHPLLFLMTLYLMFYDAEGLKRYMLYIGLGFGGSILFCLIFPNGQDLRPTEFAQHDLFTWLVQRIYAALPVEREPSCGRASAHLPPGGEGDLVVLGRNLVKDPGLVALSKPFVQEREYHGISEQRRLLLFQCLCVCHSSLLHMM